MSKNPFIEYVKVWRKENPDVLYKDALKSAAVDYKKIAKPTNTEPKPKKQKTVEEKDLKNGRTKLIRQFKKLEITVGNGVKTGKLNNDDYDEFVKIGNLLRGSSLKNAYAKKLKDVDRKMKTKKYLSLQSKSKKDEENLVMKISSNKKVESDLQKELLNKDKAQSKVKKEERIDRRKKALQQVKLPDGKRKYTDTQIDQMLKLEEQGLTSKEVKAQTSTLGKFLKEDYVKEFMRINPLFTQQNAKSYLKRNDSFRKDPYNVPVVSDPDELRNADKPPKAPPLPPSSSSLIPPVLFKMSKANQKIRDKLFEDYGINDSQYKIDDLTDVIAKDLYYGELNENLSNRKPLTNKTEINKTIKQVQRLIKAYGAERGSTYSRLQEIETLLDDYNAGLINFKSTIKIEAKKEAEQVAELLKEIADTGVPITNKMEKQVDEVVGSVRGNELLQFIEESGDDAGKKITKTAINEKISDIIKDEKKVNVLQEKLLEEKAKKKQLKDDAIAEKAKIQAEKLTAKEKAKKIKVLDKKKDTEQKKIEDEIKRLETANKKELEKKKKREKEAEKTRKLIEAQEAEKKRKLLEAQEEAFRTQRAEEESKPKPSPPPPKPAVKDITKEEIDKVRENGGLARIYIREHMSERDNRILDIVEKEENNGDVKTFRNPKSSSPKPTPKIKNIIRDKKVVEADIVRIEKLIEDQKKVLRFDELYKMVMESYKTIIATGNLSGSIPQELHDLFDSALSTGMNITNATKDELEKANKTNDFSTYDRMVEDDHIAESKVDRITRLYLNDLNEIAYNDLDNLEETLTVLEAEDDLADEPTGEGFAGGSLRKHLSKAEEYWNSGKLRNHANLVRKHLKKANDILEKHPEHKISKAIKEKIDFAREIVGGALTNLSSPYTDTSSV